MTDIQHHFKELNPLNTVNNIQTFFYSKGLTLKELRNINSENDTYSNRVSINYNHRELLGSNGKGMTRDYCLASGYAELYERFCNWSNNYTNKFITNIIYKDKEPDLTIDDILKIPAFNVFFNKLFNNDEIQIRKFLKNKFNNKFYKSEYISLNKNVKNIFTDNRIVELVCGSNGLCAGNTIDEALSQGLSEQLERLTSTNFFTNECDTYYNIEKKYIKNQEILNKINLIESLGYKLYLIDLSYNFNTCVIMSCLVSCEEEFIIINFGSFPVFDIALERSITELYQGIESFKNFAIDSIYPYKTINRLEFLAKNSASFATLESFPENFFNKIINSNYNHKIFIDNANDNLEIKNYLLKIFEKLNLHPFYYDISRTDTIKAIRTFLYEDSFIITNNINNKKYNSIIFDYQDIFNLLNNVYIFTDMIQQDIDNDTLTQFFKNNLLTKFEDHVEKKFLYKAVTKHDPLTPLAPNPDKTMLGFLQLFFTNPEIIFEGNSLRFKKFFNYKEIKKYVNLKRYITSGKYSKQEIKNFFKIFNEEITDKDFYNINNPDYLFEQIYLIPIKKLIFSDEYKKIVEIIAGLT